MFGAGWWKHDAEAAEKLLIKAGFEKKDDGWYFNGSKFTLELSYLADTEAQAGRGVQAAYNQLQAFGLDCTIVSKSSATWDVDGGQGNYYLAGYWPSGGILKDFYSAISGWDSRLARPVPVRALVGTMRLLIRSSPSLRTPTRPATDPMSCIRNS